MEKQQKWGFLREHSGKATGKDSFTGLHRTGLDEYLKELFPKEDWVHDKAFGKRSDGVNHRIRPDYLCEKLKIIVEFDGIDHYRKPSQILKDQKNTEIYQKNGFKVVRIPYFVQLTNEVVEILFGIKHKNNLFNPNVPSLSSKGSHSPAYLCPAGLKRMAKEYKMFSQQYKVNVDSLKKENHPFLTGVDLLEAEYNKV